MARFSAGRASAAACISPPQPLPVDGRVPGLAAVNAQEISTWQFDRYRVHFYSARQHDWDVRIDLDWHGTPCATLLFMKAGRALPPNSSDNGVTLLHYPITHYPAVIDLLRNEEPLYVSLNADNGAGLISTGAERVGEDEGS